MLPVEGSIRLTGDENPQTGRLEIYHAGVWGTVCSKNFGVNSGMVACRQLRYVRAEKVTLGSSMSKTTPDLPVWISGVHCQGTEEELQECFNRNNYGSHICSHEEDVHISCSGRANG